MIAKTIPMMGRICFENYIQEIAHMIDVKDKITVLTNSRSQQILNLIWMDEMTVTEIYTNLRIEQSNASAAISKLYNHEFLKLRIDGKKHYYCANLGKLDDFIDLIQYI